VFRKALLCSSSLRNKSLKMCCKKDDDCNEVMKYAISL